MTPENFCYWLQGFTELQPGMEAPTPAQWKAITEHLQHVFQKVTPPVEPAAGPALSTPAGANDPRKDGEQIRQSLLDDLANRDWGFPLYGPGMTRPFHTTITC